MWTKTVDPDNDSGLYDTIDDMLEEKSKVAQTFQLSSENRISTNVS